MSMNSHFHLTRDGHVHGVPHVTTLVTEHAGHCTGRIQIRTTDLTQEINLFTDQPAFLDRLITEATALRDQLAEAQRKAREDAESRRRPMPKIVAADEKSVTVELPGTNERRTFDGHDVVMIWCRAEDIRRVAAGKPIDGELDIKIEELAGRDVLSILGTGSI